MYRFSIQSTYLDYELELTEEIDHESLEMISRNKIEHILPVTFHQIDFKRVLRYNISSTISLSKFLSGTLSRERVINIFKSICEAVMMTEEYLLDNAAFVLDPRYIFVDPASGEAGLVYLATVEERDRLDLLTFFRKLLMSIKPDLNDGCSHVIVTIMAYLNSNDHFFLAEFVRILQKQEQIPSFYPVHPPITEQTPHNPPKEPTYPAKPKRPSSNRNSTPHQPPKKEETPRPKEQNSPVPPTPNGSNAAKERGFDVPRGKKQSFEVPGGKKRKFEIPGKEKKQAKEKPKTGGIFDFFSKRLGDEKKEFPHPKGAKKKGREYILVLTSGDERYPYSWVIDQPEFFIGRSRNNNHGILSGVSNDISRTHCKIIKENGSYFAMDLGSKFGTTLDGVACLPNERSVEITDGSILRLPGISFKAEYREKERR